jgi:hypothetical protein
MRDELLMILNMLADQKLSVEESRRLIEALATRPDGTALDLPADRLTFILDGVRTRTLTPAQAVDALYEDHGDAAPGSSDHGRAPRWLRIVVDEGGRRKVNVRLPMGLVNVGLRLAEILPGRTVTVNGRTVDIAEVVDQLRRFGPGQMLEVDDDDEHVEIWLE